MITKEMIVDVLKDMNLRPKIDEDGDINVRYRLRHVIVFLETKKGHDGYVQIVMPRLYPLENQNEQMCALYVCNKVTRESKHVKAWVDDDMDDIFATSEFFANTKKELAIGLKNGLDLLSTVSYVVKQEMSNYLNDENDDDDDDDVIDDVDDEDDDMEEIIDADDIEDIDTSLPLTAGMPEEEDGDDGSE